MAQDWNLILSRGARRLLVIAIVLGALGYIGQITAQAVIGAHNYDQTSTLNSAVATLNSSFKHYEQNVEDCPRDATQVACVEDAAGTSGLAVAIVRRQRQWFERDRSRSRLTSMRP